MLEVQTLGGNLISVPRALLILQRLKLNIHQIYLFVFTIPCRLHHTFAMYGRPFRRVVLA